MNWFLYIGGWIIIFFLSFVAFIGAMSGVEGFTPVDSFYFSMFIILVLPVFFIWIWICWRFFSEANKLRREGLRREWVKWVIGIIISAVFLFVGYIMGTANKGINSNISGDPYEQGYTDGHMMRSPRSNDSEYRQGYKWGKVKAVREIQI